MPVPGWEENPLLSMGFMALILLGLGVQDFIPPCYVIAGLLWVLSAACALGVGISQRYGYARLGWFFAIAMIVTGLMAVGLELATKLAEHRSKE